MMQIQRIQGRDLEDALNRARETCGDEAVVLSQEADPTGGVLLSVTRRTTSVTTPGSFSSSTTAMPCGPGTRATARPAAPYGR